MAKSPKAKEPATYKDADKRRDAVLKRMLETPPQHKTAKRKKRAGAKSPTSAA
jgi:hypothetical protein